MTARTTSTLFWFWCALSCCLGTAACSAPRPVLSQPPDFAVSVTVLGSDSAWYLVGADNTLRASQVVRGSSTPTPPIVRVLSRAEVAGVYERTMELAADPQAIAIADDTGALPPSPALRPRAVIVSRSVGGTARSYLFLPAPHPRGGGHAWALCESLAEQLRTLSHPDSPARP